MLGECGRGELNDNGKSLLTITSDKKLDLTNTFFSTSKGEVLHSFNDINSRTDRKRIDYILTRQTHQPPVYDVKVHLHRPPPAKAHSDHNILYAMVRLSGRIARANAKPNPIFRPAEVSISPIMQEASTRSCVNYSSEASF